MGIIIATTRTITITTAITITIIITTSDLALPTLELAQQTGGPLRGVGLLMKTHRFGTAPITIGAAA
jgi:hypothetical protein